MRIGLLTGGALALATVGAVAGDRETIHERCGIQLQLGDAGCDCIADRAMAELNETQREFLIAAVKDDAAGRQRGYAEMSGPELMEVTNFLTQAPTDCAGG